MSRGRRKRSQTAFYNCHWQGEKEEEEADDEQHFITVIGRERKEEEEKDDEQHFIFVIGGKEKRKRITNSIS